MEHCRISILVAVVVCAGVGHAHAQSSSRFGIEGPEGGGSAGGTDALRALEGAWNRAASTPPGRLIGTSIVEIAGACRAAGSRDTASMRCGDESVPCRLIFRADLADPGAPAAPGAIWSCHREGGSKVGLAVSTDDGARWGLLAMESFGSPLDIQLAPAVLTDGRRLIAIQHTDGVITDLVVVTPRDWSPVPVLAATIAVVDREQVDREQISYAMPDTILLIAEPAGRQPARTRVFRWAASQLRFEPAVVCPDPRPLLTSPLRPETAGAMDEWLSVATPNREQQPFAVALRVPRVTRGGSSYAAYAIARTIGPNGCPALLVRAAGFSQRRDRDAPDRVYERYGVVDIDPLRGGWRAIEPRVGADDPRVERVLAGGRP